jgi:hypothetical protein
LSKRLAAVEAENAALREKLNLPPKTPDNSSTPPSQGRKASSEPTRKPKGKAHAGAYRPLHPLNLADVRWPNTSNPPADLPMHACTPITVPSILFRKIDDEIVAKWKAQFLPEQ